MFRGAFRDELMCMMHFQILVLLSAEARLQREVNFIIAMKRKSLRKARIGGRVRDKRY